ncbi:MAG: hypothetical protein JHC31_06995 [Sulfurihydrogenibium sp.]|jgi:hypothetical protein|nr:hypothetical protein [Sulfurihydrogenibium sp.]
MRSITVFGFLIGLSLISVGYGYTNDPVDYWGDVKKEPKKVEEKKQQEKKEDLQKVMVIENKYESMDDKALMSLPPDKLLQMSIDAYNQKIKKNLTPIEYAYFMNPNDPQLQMAYRKWIEYQNSKAMQVANPQIAIVMQETAKIGSIVNELNKKGYEILFFSGNDANSLETDRVITMLQQNGMKVSRYSLKDTDIFKKWKINAVPTTILLSKKENKAFKLVGVIKMEDVIPLLSKVANNGD